MFFSKDNGNIATTHRSTYDSFKCFPSLNSSPFNRSALFQLPAGVSTDMRVIGMHEWHIPEIGSTIFHWRHVTSYPLQVRKTNIIILIYRYVEEQWAEMEVEEMILWNASSTIYIINII